MRCILYSPQKGAAMTQPPIFPTNRRMSGRLRQFTRLLEHARESLGIGFGFVLWDGSTVPPDWPADALALAIADEGAIAALIRRPTIDTLANLWVAARIDIRNGTIFDLVAARPSVRSRALLRSLSKKLLLGTLARFLFVPRGGPFPLQDIPAGVKGGTAEANRRNVSYHYDASNAFYALFLDPAMVYSCAYFTDWNTDLVTAQFDKLDMICRKLRLRRDDRFLDIGCGWGALVCHAARYYGVQAVGVTLSTEQLVLVKQRIAATGLSDRITLELRDFASLTGEFDKIASIGMSTANLQRHGFEVHDIEGWREHYARTCRRWHDRLLDRFDEAVAAVGAGNAFAGSTHVSASSAITSPCHDVATQHDTTVTGKGSAWFLKKMGARKGGQSARPR